MYIFIHVYQAIEPQPSEVPVGGASEVFLQRSLSSPEGRVGRLGRDGEANSYCGCGFNVGTP